MSEIGADIAKAKMILQSGGLVAIPTETVYGLGANALDTAAVTKIFSVKNRPHFDPLIVHVGSVERSEKYVEDFPPAARVLADRFWPGALTVLLKKKEIIPDLVTSGMDRVGIRCPDHPLTQALLKLLDFPLAAPSANPFGYISPTTPAHVNEQLGDKIDYILDGGPCSVGIESTIVGFEHDQPFLYRMGGVSLEKIEEVIGPVTIMDNSSNAPQTPGQLKSHYAPGKRLILGNIANLITTFRHQSVGILSWKRLWKEIDPKYQVILSPAGNLEEAAQRLFLAMRELDKMDIQFILAEEVPEVGLGKAINDRLRRASAQEA